MVREAILRLYTPIYTIRIPSCGRVRLACQPWENRYLFHVSYAAPLQRGTAIVIEDIVPLYGVPVTLRMQEKPVRVRLVPQEEEIPYTYENGILTWEIPKVDCYQMVEIDYES